MSVSYTEALVVRPDGTRHEKAQVTVNAGVLSVRADQHAELEQFGYSQAIPEGRRRWSVVTEEGAWTIQASGCGCSGY